MSNGCNIVLRVHFAALNPADRYLAQGEYPAKPPMPHILGRDGSGEIAAAGSMAGSGAVVVIERSAGLVSSVTVIHTTVVAATVITSDT